MRRVFGLVEVIFNIFYLSIALFISVFLLLTSKSSLPRLLAGTMALILVVGDSFHLLPRLNLIMTGNKNRLKSALGRGKQVTSISMSIFYLILWHIGLTIFPPLQNGFLNYIMYFLVFSRVLLCLLPQNKWTDSNPPLSWGIYRNIPFFLQGMLVAYLFFINRNINQDLWFVWLAIILSFAFYLPVVLWVHKNPKIGMLMLPKTITYTWLLVICISL